MSDADRMEALNNATRDRLWREAENCLGMILQVSLFGPQNETKLTLTKGVMALVASELVYRVREREKEEQS